MLVTGLNSIEQRYPGLTIVPAMVNSQNTLLRVVNETDTPVSLASNTALGIARNFNPNAITQFADFYEETECPSCTGNEHECPDSETAPVLPDADSSNQCPSTTIQHCDSCESTGQSEVTSIDRSSQCSVHDSGVSNQAETTFGKSGIPHSSSDQQGGQLRSNHPDQVHNCDAIPNLNPGGYYRCTQNSMPNPTDKIPSLRPQRDSDINDPSEPYDDYLKFNIENDNLSSAEIKDFEKFLFSNDKRFSVTRENMGYNLYHPHIVDVEGQNPSNMRKCRYYRLTPFMQKFMDKEIATLLKLGFIEPSTSSWRSPALLVKKPNGDFRLVVNYKNLKLIKPQHFPLVTAEELWCEMGQQKPRNTRPRGRIARWILELQGYDFEIQYRPGKSNAAADALSRLPSYPPSTETQPHISSTPIIMTTDFMDSDNAFDNVNEQDQHSEPQLEKFEWCEAQLFETETLPSHEFCFDLSDIELPTEQQNCPVIGDLYRFIDTGLVPAGDSLTQADIASQDQYAIMDGVLIHFYQPRVKHKDQFNLLIKQIVVPEKYRARLLKEYHASLAGGCHQGSDRLFLSIRQKYYWKRMWTDIHEFQKSCDKCQRASHYHPPKQPLHPLPVPNLFERLHLDYLGPLRTSSCGKKWIFWLLMHFLVGQNVLL